MAAIAVTVYMLYRDTYLDCATVRMHVFLMCAFLSSSSRLVVQSAVFALTLYERLVHHIVEVADSGRGLSYVCRTATYLVFPILVAILYISVHISHLGLASFAICIDATSSSVYVYVFRCTYRFGGDKVVVCRLEGSRQVFGVCLVNLPSCSSSYTLQPTHPGPCSTNQRLQRTPHSATGQHNLQLELCT